MNRREFLHGAYGLLPLGILGAKRKKKHEYRVVEEKKEMYPSPEIIQWAKIHAPVLKLDPYERIWYRIYDRDRDLGSIVSEMLPRGRHGEQIRLFTRLHRRPFCKTLDDAVQLRIRDWEEQLRKSKQLWDKYGVGDAL